MTSIGIFALLVGLGGAAIAVVQSLAREQAISAPRGGAQPSAAIWRHRGA